MTDPEQHNTSDEIPAETSSPGEMLREGRERMKLSQTDVAQRLRLRLAIIEDLEEDRFSKYVAGTFTRGYLRAYARLVKVDETRLFKAYEQLGVEEHQEQPMQSFSRRTSQQTHDSRLMAVTYIIGAVIIGSAVIFWWQNTSQEQDEATPANEPVSERLVEEQDPQVEFEEEPADTESSRATRDPILIDPSIIPVSSDDPQAEQAEAAGVDPDMRGEVEESEPAETGVSEEAENDPADVTEQADEPVSAPEVLPVEEADDEQSAAESEQEAAESEQTADAGSEPLPDSELVLTFEDECWIRIEDSTGQAIAFGVKMPGQVVELDGDAPYQITLGAPENVNMVFRGDDVDLSGYRSGRVARIELPRAE